MTSRTASPFLLGVNYPWLRYAQDFGRTPAGHSGISLPDSKQKVREDFARIRDCGASVVRWFLFGDGRGGFVATNDIPREPDEFLFDDVAAALELADQFGVKLCFSLFDYIWLQHVAASADSPHHRVLHFAAGREAFLQNVLIPLFREFRAHPALFAWEIANEPEWAIHEFRRAPSAKMHIADFRAFAREITRAIHEFAEVPATLGSARLIWLHAWTGLNLDFYQAHYYPSSENDTGLNLAAQLAKLPHLDRPLWLGELPAQDPSAAGYSLSQALSVCRGADLQGAAVWRWTKPESSATDVSIGCVDPATLRAWNQTERAQGTTA